MKDEHIQHQAGWRHRVGNRMHPLLVPGHRPAFLQLEVDFPVAEVETGVFVPSVLLSFGI